MLEDAPHILVIRTVTPLEKDEFGRPIPGTGGESWDELTECFCHDNSQTKEVSINGVLWVYSYHVVYEGEKIALGTKVRCLDKITGKTVGEGEVKKNAECYIEDLKGRCDIWM
ncbi:hypothetical protein AAE250_20815 [Bacteroides sp. GD17]|jgi:hypothetical protein|uniref:hypothetical protein n=1 Tax=Bacteroides sp. GD17 TaxID=3139826 RepID=UPI002053E4F9|nr:hypothetical protein [uncultured Bacteroides sp.]DAV89743.1 MAG TPA: hypothetical protein [Caudoviricetes sp.]